jgi:membrane-bound lytic murein transglycosylase B
MKRVSVDTPMCNNAAMFGSKARATFILALVSILMGLPNGEVASAQEETDFQSYVRRLGQQAIDQGVSRRTVEAVIPTLYFQQRVVDLDRAQPGGPPNAPIPKIAPYLAQHVDSARINRGRDKYQSLRGLLSRVERQTGVPESIMVAIWGHETNYGSFTGNFDLANSLATLAYDGRRRELFAGEFIATLKMMDRGFPRDQLKGSWAGATGYPQFLPSIYIRLAKDGDGDGRADIWRNEADALASIANYFNNAGWRPNVPWGVRASVPSTIDWASLANRTNSPRCERVQDRHTRWMTVSEWRALGVTSAGGKPLRDSEMTSLFQPDGPGTPAYLLTGNYRVILDYNCSNFYALSVGLLADAVEG